MDELRDWIDNQDTRLRHNVQYNLNPIPTEPYNMHQHLMDEIRERAGNPKPANNMPNTKPAEDPMEELREKVMKRRPDIADSDDDEDNDYWSD